MHHLTCDVIPACFMSSLHALRGSSDGSSQQQGEKGLVRRWVFQTFLAVGFKLAAEHCLQVILWWYRWQTLGKPFYISQPLASASHVST